MHKHFDQISQVDVSPAYVQLIIERRRRDGWMPALCFPVRRISHQLSRCIADREKEKTGNSLRHVVRMPRILRFRTDGCLLTSSLLTALE